jgi:MFS family permease
MGRSNSADVSGRPRRLSPQDYRLLGIAALGGALEFYDFIIFVFFAVVIGKLFFPPGVPEWLLTIQVFGIFGTGYLVRPLGGIVLAHFGDLFGRKRIFAFSILLMALSTLGMASLPVYASIGVAAPVLLVITRILQGAAIGGEVPGAWTFVAEHVPSRQVGFGCGVLCAGLTLGILLGVFIAALINEVFTPADVAAFAWRIPFFIGAVFGLIAVYLRRWLRETPVFSEMERSHRLVPELPLKVVLRDYPHSIVISLLLTWFLSAGVVVTTLMTATFLQQLYGYTAQQSLLATGFGTLFLIFGSAAAGAIVDRVGSRGFFVAGSIFFGAATFTFYRFAAASLPIALALYALMGLSVGVVGAVPYAMVRAFPARVRFTGVSFSYNLSYAVFGGLTPVAVALLLPLNPMAPAYYLLFIAALALGIGLYLCKNGDGLEFPAGIEERAALACQQ